MGTEVNQRSGLALFCKVNKRLLPPLQSSSLFSMHFKVLLTIILYIIMFQLSTKQKNGFEEAEMPDLTRQRPPGK